MLPTKPAIGTATAGGHSAAPAASASAGALASDARPQPKPSAKNNKAAPTSSKPTPAAAADEDAAFRKFFTQLSTAEINAAGAVAPANASASASSHSASMSASAPPHAQEAYRQLHSSLPVLHATHLDALACWLSGEFTQQRRLPSHLAPNMPFELSVELLEAVRSQAKLAPVYSRAQAAGGAEALKVATAGVVPKSNNGAAAVDDDQAEEPSFAEVLAADAGQAKSALSRRRGAGGSALSASSTGTAAGSADVTVSAPAVPVDSRMASAAHLYAVLLVQSLPLLLRPSAVPSSHDRAPSSTAPAEFLRAIPRSLEAEARRAAEEAARHLAAVVRFETEDSPIVEEDVDALETKHDDDDSDADEFTADPQPESEDEAANQGGAWGSLDSLPVDAHAIAALHAPSALKETNSALLRDKILQLTSLWDADVFTLGSVWSDARLDEHLVRIWELASAPASAARAQVFDPALDAGQALEQLRVRILELFRAGLLANAAGSGSADNSAMQRMWTPLVSSALGLPQCIPGMGGDPLSLLPPEPSEQQLSFRQTIDPQATLINLLSQVCTRWSPVAFPANPSGAASSVASSSPSSSLTYLHSFVTHNLAWLARRLGSLRGCFVELVESGESLRFAPGLRSTLDEMYAIVHVVAFWVLNHPARKESAAVDDADPLGSKLLDTGMLSHVVALVLMSNHRIFHTHVASNGSSVADSALSAFCAHCRSYEATRAATEVMVDACVTKEGRFKCVLRPAVSAFRAAAASSDGSIALPSATAVTNPLHLVHHLLLVICSSSVRVARHLFAHPTFLARVHCACYEEQHVLPALLLPLIISLHTRNLSAEDVARLPAAVVAQQSPATSAAAAPVASKKEKAPKKKLLVSAMPLEDDSSTSAAASSSSSASAAGSVSGDVAALNSWGDASNPNPLLLLASLRRCLHVVETTLARLVPANSDAASASSNSSTSSSSSPPLDPAVLSTQLQLLSHLLHHLHLWSSQSPQHKRLLLRLISPAAESVVELYAADRNEERKIVSQILSALFSQLRAMLPAVTKQIQARLAMLAAPVLVESDAVSSPAASASSGADSSAPADSSDHLSALMSDADSAAGHSRRQLKQALDQCLLSVQRLQQWSKSVVGEVAKKD